MDAAEFLQRVDALAKTNHERAIFLLWWAGSDDPSQGLKAKDIAAHLEKAGHPRQNVTRLNNQLVTDIRTAKDASGGRRLRPAPRRQLDEKLAQFIRRKVVRQSSSVLPMELFEHTRGYIEKVVDQINKSFDFALYDCCAVMCRRLLETLIIETYEHLKRDGEIKGIDGHYFMLGALITHLEKDRTITLSRNGTKGLIDFKSIGDVSAHNRRFNAHASDIERVRNGIRVASEELLHLSGLRN